MRFPVLLLTLVPLGSAALLRIPGTTVNVVSREIDCASYGSYEPYTGPCETTNCGVSGKNCLDEGSSSCVGFPNVKCPFKGCSCSNF
ncbi:hypothetical protein K504DRAFT_498706 [Pleomassaria siparia CBS 279.74]|uniref:Uncharacterized protein n=1 Tax=Pleomassaria siparia CBS 279.74 TaxID=1314801 RepID=A0A6G1KM47_9PLEO|nr:hypothetical protein K504DRAFT_498706 [Pleomassaria siparia CBS 279.74]